MNVYDRASGKPPFKLADTQIKRFIALLIEASLVVREKPPAKLNERRICRALHFEMLRLKREKSPSLNMRIERESTVEDDELDCDDAPEGRLDFKVLFPRQFSDERQYFGVEAKLLMELDNGLSRRYLTHGLDRYRTGLYGSYARHGMMLGLVRQGSIGAIVAAIERSVPAGWGMVLSFGPDLRVVGALAVHRRDLGRPDLDGPIDVFHVFVDMDFETAKTRASSSIRNPPDTPDSRVVG
jgi:hypothetical protein